MTAPILFFGYGNPARGDDALGPLLAERLAVWVADAHLQQRIEVLTDFQLCPEHAYDLAGREKVIFADASCRQSGPCQCYRLVAREPHGLFTHTLDPHELLWYANDLLGIQGIDIDMIAMRGYTFELGQPLSARGLIALETAWQLLLPQLAKSGAPQIV